MAVPLGAALLRGEWLDLVPTTGGFTRHPETVQRELMDGMAAAVDAASGSFIMSYTTITSTAVRQAGQEDVAGGQVLL
jgi:hypothetical protein